MKEIRMEHGAGGEKMRELLNLILNYFVRSAEVRSTEEEKERSEKSEAGVKVGDKDGMRSAVEVSLEDMDDAAVVEGVVFTTDSYTVKPLFFPGGDIGLLAIAGTVNDISVMGALPLCISVAFVIEEGFPMRDFERILESMKKTCEEAGVEIVTGDTKVVEKGAVDRMIVTTSAVGKRSEALKRNFDEVRKFREVRREWLLDSNIREGDVIIVSGYIGDHGVALLAAREGISFHADVKSDVAPLNRMIEGALEEGGIVAMKDPTRGGLSNALNEFAAKSGVGIIIEEEKIPVRASVRNACEMLGIDPLEIGNEGKVVLAVVKEKAEAVLDALKQDKRGRNAEIIGYATKDVKGVVMKTCVGSHRIVESPVGDPVPRIC